MSDATPLLLVRFLEYLLPLSNYYILKSLMKTVEKMLLSVSLLLVVGKLWRGLVIYSGHFKFIWLIHSNSKDWLWYQILWMG